MRLENKVVVVTGASSGVGREVALRFAKEGAKVVAVARRAERLAALEEQSKELAGEIVAYAGDISLEETNEKMIDFAIEKFGKFDVLVNNAGLMDNFAPAENLDTELMERLMKVDVYGPAWATRKAVRVFLENENGGNIVNIASIAGLCGGKSGCAYTMAKHAVIGLTKNTAFTYRNNKIRCNAICPGGINTEMADPSIFATADQKGIQNAMLAMNFGVRSAEAIEIADVALFLASDAAAVVNGAVVTADSGLTSF
ncbi:MAG: SDR family oxidoreductase [Clostridia bacterium]|nr:SDR family oxidoreductase [Clostridia bacterium]